MDNFPPFQNRGPSSNGLEAILGRLNEISLTLARTASAMERAAAASPGPGGGGTAGTTGGISTADLNAAIGALRTEIQQGITNGPASAQFMQATQPLQGGSSGPPNRPSRSLSNRWAGMAVTGMLRRYSPWAMAYEAMDLLRDTATQEARGETPDLRDRIPIFGPAHKAGRDFKEEINRNALSLGMDYHTLRGLSVDMGSTVLDPLTKKPVGAAAVNETMGNLRSFRVAGADESGMAAMANRLLSEFGRKAAGDAAKTLGPFMEDPLTRDKVLGEYRRRMDNNNLDFMNPILRGMGRKGFDPFESRLDKGFVISSVLEHGLSDTHGVLSTLLKGSDPEKMKELQDFALKFSDKMKTSELGVSIGNSRAVIAGSRFERVMASGAEIDSAPARAARAQEIKAIEGHIKALEERANTLRQAGTLDQRGQEALEKYTAELETARTSLAQLRQQDRSQVSARQVQRLNVQSSLYGLSAVREGYGLAPGAVAPSLKAQQAVQQATIRKNEEIASDPTRLPQERDAARLAASKAKNDLIDLRRLQDYQQYGVPRLLTEGFTGRALSRLQNRMSEGAGMGELTPLLREGVRTATADLRKAREELAFQQSHRDRYGAEDIEKSRDSLFEKEEQLRKVRQAQALTPGELALSDVGRRGSVLGAELDYRRSLLLGPASDRADLNRALALMKEKQEGLYKQSEEQKGQKNYETAADLKAQADAMTPQIKGASLAGLSDFHLSARNQNALSMGRLQIALESLNPLGMGPSIGSFSRQNARIGGALSQFQAQISAAPPEQRDALEAALSPQMSSLRLEAALNRRSMFGEGIKSLFSLTFGAPSGSGVFLEPYGAAQQYARRTGTPLDRRLGGTYEGPDLERTGMDALRSMNETTLQEGSGEPGSTGTPPSPVPSSRGASTPGQHLPGTPTPAAPHGAATGAGQAAGNEAVVKAVEDVARGTAETNRLLVELLRSQTQEPMGKPHASGPGSVDFAVNPLGRREDNRTPKALQMNDVNRTFR
jgi:hypothetical protein